MKSKRKRWSPDIQSPWLTRSEAADYLRCSMKTIDRKCILMRESHVPGKLRRQCINGEFIQEVRILAEDVYAIIPLPDDVHRPDRFTHPRAKAAGV